MSRSKAEKRSNPAYILDKFSMSTKSRRSALKEMFLAGVKANHLDPRILGTLDHKNPEAWKNEFRQEKLDYLNRVASLALGSNKGPILPEDIEMGKELGRHARKVIGIKGKVELDPLSSGRTNLRQYGLFLEGKSDAMGFGTNKSEHQTTDAVDFWFKINGKRVSQKLNQRLWQIYEPERNKVLGQKTVVLSGGQRDIAHSLKKNYIPGTIAPEVNTKDLKEVMKGLRDGQKKETK